MEKFIKGIAASLITAAIVFGAAAIVSTIVKQQKKIGYMEQLICAYDHYHKSASFFLNDDGWDPPYECWPKQVESLFKSERELDTLFECHVLPLPPIVEEANNQRDKLSDAIRAFADVSCPEVRAQLYEMVEAFGTDLLELDDWSYSY